MEGNVADDGWMIGARARSCSLPSFRMHCCMYMRHRGVLSHQSHIHGYGRKHDLGVQAGTVWMVLRISLFVGVCSRS